ncbi:hypothetical protein KAI31_01320 [Candidatus Bathyarchaeota archaeon]|nr:hypothetical protein [Candidatus Bathyarchaeota archaeon]
MAIKYFICLFKIARAKIAETVEKVCELVEASFEYVTDIDQKKIFCKRK